MLSEAEDVGPAVVRLEGIQRQLVAPLDLLDPRSVRFPRFRVAFDRHHHTASTLT
ncbi:hypothetical protein ACFYYH_14030 [Streptomyces sp. NPDC002018]|uniref:hypothetical protein n=1 Tax=Streptomyces sp. NPDC002018 TaxID=3364629 RepID=UPI0036919526